MGQTQAWCIAWVTKGGSLPGELSDALARRGIQCVVARSDYEVVAQAARRKGCASGGDVLIVILVEPGALPPSETVLDACERRWRRVAAWEYVSGANPPLRSHVRKERAPEPVPAAARNGKGPRLRLVDGGVERRSENADGLLTREELKMLLGEESGRREGET